MNTIDRAEKKKVEGLNGYNRYQMQNMLVVDANGFGLRKL